MPAFRSKFLAACAGCLLLLAARLGAAEGGFVATLSGEQLAAAGLSALSGPERTSLDQMVAAELALVRGGELRNFAGSFVSRRTEAERHSAGLDRLSPAELARLDALVAAALAARPKPKERPRIKDSDIFVAAPRPEIHGAVSLTLGWGGGGSFRASSFWVDYFDPATGLGLGFGLSNVTGKGFYNYYPDYAYSPDGGAGPAYFDAAYRTWPRDEFVYGSGQSFCAPDSGEAAGRGHRRR